MCLYLQSSQDCDPTDAIGFGLIQAILQKAPIWMGYSVPGKESCIPGQWSPMRKEDEGITRLLVRVGEDSLYGIDKPLFGHGADEAVHDAAILEQKERWQALNAVSDRR